VAFATLLLASVTGWLAWTTRRLARATAEEVVGQIRPVVVPIGDTAHAQEADEDRWPEYFDVKIGLRNIGAGPALNFNMTIGEGSRSEPLVALGAGSDDRALVHVPVVANEGPMTYHSRTAKMVVEYFDLGGRRYVTEIWFGILNRVGDTKLQRSIKLGSGVVPREGPISGPALLENPLMAAKEAPGIRKLPSAWRYYVLQDPDALPGPLLPRLKEAWSWMYPRHRRTRTQRLMWARRAYKSTLDKPVRPWARGVLHRPYVTARGLRWSYRVYRNLRY